MTEDTIIRNIYRGAVSVKEPLKDGEARVAQCKAPPARSLEGWQEEVTLLESDMQ